jgi:ATP-binding cassette subfamily B protein
MTATGPAPVNGRTRPGSAPAAVSGERRLARRLARELRPYWLRIAGLLLVSMLATPLALLTPVPLKLVIDSVLGGRPVPALLAPVLPSEAGGGLLVAAALMLVAVAALTQLQDLTASVLRVLTGERVVLDLRTRLFRHLQRLSVSYHDLRGTTDSTYRIQYDAMALQGIATDTVPSFVTATVTLAAMLLVTMLIDLPLGLVALGVVPILLVVSWRYRRRLRRQARRVKRLESGAMSLVQEALAGVRVVQAFGREAHEEQRFTRQFHESMWARVRYAVASSGYAVAVGLTVATGTAAVLYLGVRHVQSGRITLGDLVLIMAYLAQLYAPLKTMSKKAGSLQGYLASAERVFALLDEEPDVRERAHPRPLRRARGEVVLDRVSFGYHPRRPVLELVSLVVPPGTRVGVVGATGAGKTTCVSLLNRFHDPTSGRILLDGIDLRDYRLADLRNQFAIVLQEPLLFSTSIGENIAYARPEASLDDIVVAATAAGAHEFITALPDGYDTPVGERGARLSGGERQRISLARAFLKDAPVLILDEPTSAVDLRTEAQILAAMDRLMAGRTTFLIAHRLSTLQRCDERVELAGGRLTRTPEEARP